MSSEAIEFLFLPMPHSGLAGGFIMKSILNGTNTLYVAAILSAAALSACSKSGDTTTPPPAPTAAAPDNTPAAPATPATPAMPAMPAAPAAPAANANAAESDAQSKLAQVMTYIQQNKLDLAEKSLSDLESNKSSLPADVQNQLPQARAALTAAQAKSGSMPAMPSLPGH
jgi:hypothetical protein